ncbi:helix-turn-helix domain-containing protein [Conexibacter sp. W3-3-2]|nr:helix-turn-helix domain-containing protein [Conexibacter sp. W3-3-2]
MSLNPLLLRTSREALGLTQTEFAVRGGFAQAEISRWEKGIRDPTPEQIERLAAAAELPVALLTSEKRVGQPVHRSQKRERRTVSKTVNARLEIARFALEDLLDTVDLDEPPLAFADPDELIAQSPETAATLLRRAWGVGSGPLPLSANSSRPPAASWPRSSSARPTSSPPTRESAANSAGSGPTRKPRIPHDCASPWHTNSATPCCTGNASQIRSSSMPKLKPTTSPARSSCPRTRSSVNSTA